MTNILNIPLIDGNNTSFTLPNNAAWTDSIYFGAPGYGPPFAIAGCSTVVGSGTVTVPATTTTVGVQPKMQVSGTPGIPAACYVGAVTSATTFTIVDIFGNSLNALATSSEITATFQPPPLDLSGIGFVSNLRRIAGDAQVFLTAQTGNGTMSNGATLGTVTWNVPAKTMQAVPAGNYVLDLLAADSTYIVNLIPKPAKVTVLAGISDPTLLTGISHP